MVDSGAFMHMMSKIRLTPEELEDVNVSRLPTTAITANGSIDTTEERERFGHVRCSPTPRRHSSSIFSWKQQNLLKTEKLYFANATTSRLSSLQVY